MTYETAESLVRQRLSEGSAAHCVRVAEMSALLAAVYSVDVEEARIAGVLHDWSREDDGPSMLQAARTSSRVADSAEVAVPYLLHAEVGAAEIREAHPDVSEQVVDAVKRHTMGDEVMTDLDRVVYIADMIEPARDYPGVDDLREAVGNVSLEDLFSLAYQRSVAHLVESRKYIHPKTVAVWNAHVARRQK